MSKSIVIILLLQIQFFYCIAQFLDITDSIGIKHTHFSNGRVGGGAVFFDYNNDGFEDLFITGGSENDILYENLGNGKFHDVSIITGVALATSGYFSHGVVSGDINNDGCEDILVLTMKKSTNLLLKNNCNGEFIEISAKAGLTEEIPSTAAVFIDANEDGYLDIYVNNYMKKSNFFKDADGNIIGYEVTCYPNNFYINNQDETFTEMSTTYNVDNRGCSLGLMATDFDKDGDTDIFLVNDHGEVSLPNAVFENNFPDEHFIDKSTELNLDNRIYGMGIAMGDYNSDGEVDFYMTNIGNNILMEKSNNAYINEADNKNVNNGFKNDGAKNTGWGTFFFDFDNDSDLDLFVANGYLGVGFFEYTTEYEENVLYTNDGSGNFENQTEIMGMSSTKKDRGSIFSDYDKDGDLDVFVVSVSKETDSISDYSSLYQNITHSSNNWIELKLEGTVSNRSAFGTTVTLFMDNSVQERELISGGSFASQSSSILHFGLGLKNIIDSIKVDWNKSETTTFYNVKPNSIYYIKEKQNKILKMGCMDEESNDFNPDAEYNIGCYVEKRYGCTDLKAINFDSMAITDDGNCQYEVVEDKIVLDLKQNEVIDNFYPNPVHSELTIDLSETHRFSKRINVNIETLDGRLLYKVEKNIDDLNIDISNLRRGVYFIQLIDFHSKIKSKRIRIIKTI